MKKLLIVILAVLLLAGCTADEDIAIDIDALANEIKSDVVFDDELLELNQDAVCAMYSINSEDVIKVITYVSMTGAAADELIVVEAVDSDAAVRVSDSLSVHIEKQTANFESYIAEEVPKLKDAVFSYNGKYVVVCVTNDTKTAKNIVDKYFN